MHPVILPGLASHGLLYHPFHDGAGCSRRHLFACFSTFDEISMLFEKKITYRFSALRQVSHGRQRAWACTLALIMMAMAPPALPQVLPAAVPARAGDGVEGIIVNATITPNGQEFFRSFTEFWREKADGDTYNLDVVERPSRRSGNQISIAYGQKRVFLGYLPVKLDRVRALSEQAADAAYANIITVGLMSTMSVDPDVGADEL